MFKKRYIMKPSKISSRNIIAFVITVIGIVLGVFIGINIIMAHVLGIANMVDNNTFTCVRLVYGLVGVISGYLIGKAIYLIAALISCIIYE
ncbi:hypothetical protein KWL13_007440 [Clostridioides difficile]|uniref:hypothetical protein n=1 Tax=Clostridioides difficile TaxID=1496 RepID=UPI000BB1B2A2|nr:hypothetical protein [Clostridioides difficile]EGT5271460.1 hypothetical protein [Clostridioides difficile]EGT5470875.1 hypothetical protein [Clostridioides difficile]MBH8089398.1 hypothetical protein [Clostridioides difficile]MBY1610015.1 hypothetical protein [Clostridioides difficile]MBY2078216.1 hypothetical protein [Clostridioides difficile]